MKKKMILISCIGVLFVLFGCWFIGQQSNKALKLLKATENFYQEDPTNDLFDGETNLLPYISNQDTGSILVTREGKIALRLQENKKCYYKEFDEETISYTFDQNQCLSYAINYRESTSMYSWNNDSLGFSKELISNLKELKVKSLYQNISSKDLEKKYIEEIIANYTKEKIDVYRLIGDPDWAFDLSVPKKLITELIVYNQSVNEESRLKGVVFDIEPHNSQKWKKSKKKINYLKNM